MNDSEETIKKVAEEGLEARNLINYISDGSLDVKTAAKPPVSPRPHSVSPKPPIASDSNKDVDSRILLKTKRRGTLSRPKSRLRSASAGRNPEKDLRARYWTFLFENLHRAVDEIYQTCEMDESIVESKEAIMMLENYCKDFRSLIQFININKNYEKTAPINRPTSLAWEIRKSSPGKSLLKNVFIEKLTAGNSQAKRILCFDTANESKEKDSSSCEAVAVNGDPKLTVSNGIFIKEPSGKKLNNSRTVDVHLDKNSSDISISVVPETNNAFPCNESLVINEICCLSDKVLVEKPSVIVEAENESININSTATDYGPLKNENAMDSDLKSNVNNRMSITSTNSHETESQKNINNVYVENKARDDENKCDIIEVSYSNDNSNNITVSNDNSNNIIVNNESSNNNITVPADELENKNKELKNKLASYPDSLILNCNEKKTLLKKKVLVKKGSKVSEKVCSPQNSGRQISSVEDKNNVKNKTFSSTVVAMNPDKAKTVLKTVPKDYDSKLLKKNDDVTVKNMNSANINKNAAKPLAERPVNISISRPTSVKSTSSPRKVCRNTDAFEGKKSFKNNPKTSAIQRNISYVSTLSSRNQLEKAANEEKKKPLRTISHAMKMPPKSGSTSALHKISVAHKWSDKASSVEQIPEIIKPNADEDSDGWETVRSRNRCRNSPAKKIPFSSEKNGKAHDLAKLSQSRFGGFPYTTKGNTKNSLSKVTPKKDEKSCNKDKQLKNGDSSLKSLDSSNQQNSSSSKKLNNSKSSSSSPVSKNMNNEFKPNADQKSFAKTISRNETELSNESLDYKDIFELKLSEEVCSKINRNIFKSNKLIKSASDPCICIDYMKNTFSLSKYKSFSEQSLHVKKYSKIKQFSRNSTGKSMCINKRKSKKLITKLQDNDTVADTLNTSLDESDTGLTSDDQDGQTSHDEAFDAQCQDLCDTAWRYKILEQQVHKLELSWGEQMDLFDLELRTPGRALEMHEKLSSPFRKKSLMESIRLQEEKQVKAREQRERLLEEKLKRAKEIEKKRQEMKTILEQRQEKQRVMMEEKLQRAEEKRKKQIEMIVKKAHDEEEKVNEIAFINTLEAQNKRHDLISKEKDHEARLHDIQEERQRKQEEKAAKEAAAEERRKLLEAERQARLNEMQEKRKMRDHKVEQLFLVKEKERQELANQKARDREQRLSALNAQQQNSIEELQKKIQLKQEESARRHEENIEQIRQKAFELSVRRCSSNNDDAPQPVPYETKKICTLCNVLIGSEVYLLSHLRGKKHQETVKDQYQGKDPSVEELELYNLKHIVDASTDQLDPNLALDKERQKALKKRCKKLRQRMSNRGQEYESLLGKSDSSVNSNVKPKITKISADIKKFITSYEKSSNGNQFLSSLERHLNEIENVLENKLHQDKVAFMQAGGLAALIDVFKLVSSLPVEKSTFLHKKIINHLSKTAESIVDKCHENCIYILFSNKIGSLLDLLIQQLNVLLSNNYNQLISSTMKSPGLNIKVDVTAGKLMHFLSSILTILAAKHTNQNNVDSISQKENQSIEFQYRVQDVISYIVSIGMVDKLSQYFNTIQGPIGNQAEVASFLLDGIAFLTSLVKLYSDCFTSVSSSKTDDSTQLIATIKVTNMIGSVSLLYGLLLHSGVSSRGETPPPELPDIIESLVISTLCMLNHIAVMNLQAFQTILGSESLSLQLRHITSHLLWYCNHWTSDKLLHEVILLVGYFTVLNVDNQSLIQAGQSPTVLQQLCSLPFLYFSDSELTDILFPTLIACCYDNGSNKTILEQEMSSELLSNYIEVKYMNCDESLNNLKRDASEKRWLFSTRFPKNCWSTAKNYFAVK